MPEGIPYASSNVVAGTGLELNYVGSHCFAYSGLFPATTSSQTVLDFKTGSETIEGTFYTNAAVDDDSGATTGVWSEIKLNGISIAILKTGNNNIDSPTTVWLPVIIPPYTHVVITLDGDSSEADSYCSVTFTGRIYK